MLEIKNLSLALRADGRPLAQNFSFTLNRGDKAVLIGEEGNGKSTLLKYLYNPALVEPYCEGTGQVLCRGRAAYLPQLPEPALLGQTVAQLFEDAEVHAHWEVLSALGLPAALLGSSRQLNTFSGGEKVKLQLARLLMEDPDLLLLDEPTNDLDIPTLLWMENFIRTTRLAVLYVSHDETLIENTANVILHVEQLIRKTRCRITVTRAGYRDYLAARQANFAKQAQVAQKQREDYQKQMARWQQIHDKVEQDQNSVSRQDPSSGRLLKKKMKSVQAQGKRFEREKEEFLEFPETEEAILTRFSPQISLPAGKTVVQLVLPHLTVLAQPTAACSPLLAQNLCLTVTGPQHVGITGKNGAGKSTLLAVLWQQLQPRSDITAAYMPQNYAEKLPGSVSPVEYLAQRYTKAEVTRARTFLGSMKFTHQEMTGPIRALSGGQKAKLLFLEMVLQNADVLLLDEPTRNFSPLSGPVVRRALHQFGGAILSVSHDRKYLREVCDVVYELTENGLKKIELP